MNKKIKTSILRILLRLVLVRKDCLLAISFILLIAGCSHTVPPKGIADYVVSDWTVNKLQLKGEIVINGKIAWKEVFTIDDTPIYEDCKILRGRLPIFYKICSKDSFPIIIGIDSSFAKLYKISVGDQIIEIDGISTKGLLQSELTELLRGKPGNTLRIKLFSQKAEREMECYLELKEDNFRKKMLKQFYKNLLLPLKLSLEFPTDHGDRNTTTVVDSMGNFSLEIGNVVLTIRPNWIESQKKSIFEFQILPVYGSCWPHCSDWQMDEPRITINSAEGNPFIKKTSYRIPLHTVITYFFNDKGQLQVLKNIEKRKNRYVSSYNLPKSMPSGFAGFYWDCNRVHWEGTLFHYSTLLSLTPYINNFQVPIELSEIGDILVNLIRYDRASKDKKEELFSCEQAIEYANKFIDFSISHTRSSQIKKFVPIVQDIKNNLEIKQRLTEIEIQRKALASKTITIKLEIDRETFLNLLGEPDIRRKLEGERVYTYRTLWGGAMHFYFIYNHYTGSYILKGVIGSNEETAPIIVGYVPQSMYYFFGSPISHSKPITYTGNIKREQAKWYYEYYFYGKREWKEFSFIK